MNAADLLRLIFAGKKVSEMKLLLSRAFVLVIFSLLMVCGILIFTVNYFSSASTWVQFPANRHLYANGKLLSQGTVYDRAGHILLRMDEGDIRFHEQETVRRAVMHATGDLYGNVLTGAQVAFRDRLSGWNIVSGAYRFNSGRGAPGNELTLTIDADLSAVAYRELGERKGTVGVYNYETGEILCMVSKPAIDPENPPDVKAYPHKYEGVYINRLLSAAYTPGSVFKLVTAAAALDSFDNIDNKLYHCDGSLPLGEDFVTCPAAHGEVTLEQALAVSCNVAFARITHELGAAALQKHADSAGFNSSLEVDGIKTAVGRVDVSGAEGADLAWAGIGQYTNTANPLNFLAYMGAIANDGVSVTPRILCDRGLFSFLTPYLLEKKRILPTETAGKLGKMMRNNTINEYGEENFRGLELCAKSGTAEVGGGENPHAWFAGFLAREDFPLAFVVIIENGGSGSRVAGPVAAKVLQAALNGE